MDVGLSVASYCVLALMLFCILNLLKSRNTGHRKEFPPGPRGLPLIGSLHIMLLKKPHYTYLELAKKYGPVFSVKMGTRKVVVLAGYEAVKEALVNHAEDFENRGEERIFRDTDNNLGLTFSNGKNWKVMRRFTLSTLRDFGMGKSTIEEKIMEESVYLIKQFQDFKGKPFDGSMILNCAVANIIISILLGHRMDHEDPQLRKIVTLAEEIIIPNGSPEVLIYNIFPFLGFLFVKHKTVLKYVNEMREFLTKIFMKHLKTLDEDDQRSFIDAFLVRQKEEAGDPGSYFHDGNLKSLIRSLFVAGIETTSTTLRWALLLMMTYPDIQANVQEEISRVIGSAQPASSHRAQMPYTNAVIHEVQRFADLAPLSLPHGTSKDVTFRGYFIPKGTYVIPLLSSVLKDETQFERPDEFYPHHFLDSKGNFMKKDAFMPFSAGRRACVGENLARMELFIFFTSLLQKFTISFPPGVTESDLKPGTGFTNVPKPHTICAISRS